MSPDICGLVTQIEATSPRTTTPSCLADRKRTWGQNKSCRCVTYELTTSMRHDTCQSVPFPGSGVPDPRWDLPRCCCPMQARAESWFQRGCPCSTPSGTWALVPGPKGWVGGVGCTIFHQVWFQYTPIGIFPSYLTRVKNACQWFLAWKYFCQFSQVIQQAAKDKYTRVHRTKLVRPHSWARGLSVCRDYSMRWRIGGQREKKRSFVHTNNTKYFWATLIPRDMALWKQRSPSFTVRYSQANVPCSRRIPTKSFGLCWQTLKWEMW